MSSPTIVRLSFLFGSLPLGFRRCRPLVGQFPLPLGGLARQALAFKLVFS
jgi:hypothetical protein